MVVGVHRVEKVGGRFVVACCNLFRSVICCESDEEPKVLARFKQRVREITRRNRGHRVRDVIDELRLYVVGWLNYFGKSHTYKQVVELAEWVRRRVRLYYWKQWKAARTRRRNLIKLGADPGEVKMASRSRKGYWRMSSNRIVQQAMNNQWLEEQGVPDIRTVWIKLHYGPDARV